MSGPLWTVDAMVAAMRAERAGALPDAIGGISIDSRSVAPGEAFFAIKGDTHDGHDFVAAALRQGAALAVVAAEASPWAADGRTTSSAGADGGSGIRWRTPRSCPGWWAPR